MPRPKRTKAVPTQPTASTEKITHPSEDHEEESASPERPRRSTRTRDSGSDASLISQGLQSANRSIPRKGLADRGLEAGHTRKRGALRTNGDNVIESDGDVQSAAVQQHTSQTRAIRTRPRRVLKKVIQDEEQIKALAELKRSRDEALAAAKGKAEMTAEPAPAPTPAAIQVAQSSANRMDSEAAQEHLDSSLTLNDTTADMSSGAVIVPSTPAVEASVVAIANFKRRPRQPSILRMVQQQQQQVEDQEVHDSSNSDLSDPEGESTPLPGRASAVPDSLANNKTPTITSHASIARAGTSSSNRKRKAADITDGSEAHDPRSSPPPGLQTSLPSATQQSPGLRSKSPSLPDRSALHHRTGGHQANVNNPSDASELETTEMQAPPQSSSGEESEADENATGQPAHSRSVISKQRSKAQAQEKAKSTKRAGKQQKHIPTTAELRNMLPKRQNRQSSPFAIHSSSSTLLSSDNHRHRNRNRTKDGKPRNKNNDSVDEDADELTLANTNRLNRTQSRDANSTSAKRLSRTYGTNHPSSDKENALDSGTESDTSTSDGGNDRDIDDGSFGVRRRKRARVGQGGKRDRTRAVTAAGQGTKTSGAPSAELQSIAKKFAEIDAWQMSFENVSVEGSGEGMSSSPWR